jgi:carbamoyl-phosphate synthase large subunit
VIAADSDRYSLQRAEADTRRLIPRAGDPAFIAALRDLVVEFDVEFLWPGHDTEIERVARHRDELSVATFLPPIEDIEMCNDKMASYERWRAAGVPVPDTMRIASHSDLAAAFDRFGGAVWLRAVSGAGGKGALGVASPLKAEAWLDVHDGWGRFTAAEWIKGGDRLSWESVWADGELVAVQGRRQLVQGFASLTMSGITGVPGVNQWGTPPVADEIGMAAVRAVSARPHGNYGVDMVCDADGQPFVTEINIGRYNNDGLVHWPDERLNAADLAVRLGMGEQPPFDAPLMHPKPYGDYIIYGIPALPVQVSESDLQA